MKFLSPSLLAIAVSYMPRQATGFNMKSSSSISRGHFAAASASSRLFSSSSGETSPSTTTILEGPDLGPVPSTSKRLFLVRHGEVINPGGDRPVFYGAMDVPLSKLGEEEAKAAGQYLQQFDLEYVFASPLSRAVYGAEQILALQSTDTLSSDKVVTLEGFRELDRGSWCGKTKDEIGPENMARFDACDESITPEGGESYPFLKERVLKAIDEVLTKMSPGRSAAIVSHLQVTRSILSEALGIPTNEMVNLPVATASVTCIDYDEGSQSVQFQSFKPDAGLRASNDGAN